MILERISHAWRSLTRDQQRMTAIVLGGLALTLLVYLMTSGLVALAVAAVYAYLVGRYRATHRPAPAEKAPERAEAAPRPIAMSEPPATSEPLATSEPPRRPAPERRVRPNSQTPLGRLFAERPAWSGPPVGPYEPPPRRRSPAAAEDEGLTIPLQEPYDSR